MYYFFIKKYLYYNFYIILIVKFGVIIYKSIFLKPIYAYL